MLDGEPGGWLQLTVKHNPGPRGEHTDRLLVDVLGPHACEEAALRSAERFFFLRFSGYNHEIRYRLQYSHKVGAGGIITSLTERIRQAALVGEVVADTYRPEVDKHGGPNGQAVAEDQFHASSKFALEALKVTAAAPDRRLLIATAVLDLVMRSVRSLAADDEPSAASLIHALRSYQQHWVGYSRRMGILMRPANPPVRARLAHLLLNGADDVLASYPGGLEYGQHTEEHIGQLAALARSDVLTAPLLLIVLDFTHTFANRIGLSPADEALIADLVVEILARRPETVADVRQAAKVSLSASRGLVIAIEGGAARLRPEFPTVRWLAGSPLADGSRLWPRLLSRAHRDTAAAALAEEPDWLDDECPVLPDALRCAETVRAALNLGSAQPAVLAIEDVQNAEPDDWSVLLYLIRAWRDKPVIFVVAFEPKATASTWEHLRYALEIVPVLSTAGSAPASSVMSPAAQTAPPREKRSDPIREARVGRLLASLGGLRARAAEDAIAARHFVLALLRLGRFGEAASCAAHVLRAAEGPDRRLVRRVFLLAHRAGRLAPPDIGRIGSLRDECLSELADPALSLSTRTWLTLDLAALAAAVSNWSEHDRLLDQILTTPGALTIQSRVAAHLWRATSHVVAGEPERALPHQAVATALLAGLRDQSRLIHMRTRLGGTLGSLASWRAAREQFLNAAELATWAGDWSSAAIALCEAVWASCACGQENEPVHLLSRYSAIMPIWDSPHAQLSLLLAEARVAAHTGDHVGAHGRAALVLAALPGSGRLDPWTAYRAVALLEGGPAGHSDAPSSLQGLGGDLLASATPAERAYLRASAESIGRRGLAVIVGINTLDRSHSVQGAIATEVNRRFPQVLTPRAVTVSQ